MLFVSLEMKPRLGEVATSSSVQPAVVMMMMLNTLMAGDASQRNEMQRMVMVELNGTATQQANG